MKNVSLFLSAGFIFLFAVSLQAQIPRLISYQGVLTDSLNNPKPDGTYSFAFRLYEAGTGGTALWSEIKSLQIRRGLFSTLLGDQNSLVAIPFDRQYWLGIQVGSDPELLPRIPLSAVGYSFSSVKSDTARYALVAPQQAVVDSARIAGTIPDNSITTAKIANGTIQSADVAASFKAPLADTANFARAAVPGGVAGGHLSGSYPNPTIADNAVTSSKIVNGTIQFADIAQNAAASGQVMKWNGTSWIAGNDSIGTGPWQANGTTVYYTDGNVGIGTSSPAHRLSIADSLNGLRVATSTAGGALASFGGLGTFKIDAPGLAGGRLQVLENGNVGIGRYGGGVLDPVRPLDVHGAIGVYDHGTRTFLGGIASEALTEMIDFGMNDDGTGRFGGYTPASQGGLFRVDTRGGYNVFQFLARQAGSTNLISDVMDITSDGKVGIGTTTPQGALDVSSTTGAFIVPRMTTTQRDALTAVNGMIIYNTTTNQFNFRENGAWVTK